MPSKRNDVRAISDEPTSNSVALSESKSSISVLDETLLEDVSGGLASNCCCCCCRPK